MVGVVEAVVYHRRVTGWGERVAASRPQPGHCLNHPTTTLLQTTFQNTASLTVVRSTTLSQPTNCSNLQFVNYIRWKHYIFSTIQTTTLLTVVRSTTSSQHWTVPTYIAQQFVNYIQWNQYSVQTTLSQPTLHYIQFVSTIQPFQPLQHVSTIQVKWIKWEKKLHCLKRRQMYYKHQWELSSELWMQFVQHQVQWVVELSEVQWCWWVCTSKTRLGGSKEVNIDMSADKTESRIIWGSEAPSGAVQAPEQDQLLKTFPRVRCNLAAKVLAATDRRDCPKALLGHWPPYKTTINIPSFVWQSILLSHSLTKTVFTRSLHSDIESP